MGAENIHCPPPHPPKKKPGKIPVQNFASSAGTAEMLFCQELPVMKPGFITTTTNEKAINGMASSSSQSSSSVAMLEKIQSGLLQLKSWLASSGTVKE